MFCEDYCIAVEVKKICLYNIFIISAFTEDHFQLFLNKWVSVSWALKRADCWSAGSPASASAKAAALRLLWSKPSRSNCRNEACIPVSRCNGSTVLPDRMFPARSISAMRTILCRQLSNNEQFWAGDEYNTAMLLIYWILPLCRFCYIPIVARLSVRSV